MVVKANFIDCRIEEDDSNKGSVHAKLTNENRHSNEHSSVKNDC